MNLSKETGHVFAEFKVALMILLDKVAGDPNLATKRTASIRPAPTLSVGAVWTWV